ncbi:Lysozyme g [Acipenser ruthenus]|uniref:Lysozyme g n=1 Tax=Acipenser ruthenus TaxID=7906 RepID=A0A444V3A4_ACIRT|nr:Lysozyme g [Acipenser ruthenus]
MACIYGDVTKIDTTGASEKTAKQDKLTVKGVAASHKLAEHDLANMNKYKPLIIKVGRAQQMDPCVIAGIISRESRAGTQLKDGWSTDKKGFGLMQERSRLESLKRESSTAHLGHQFKNKVPDAPLVWALRYGLDTLGLQCVHTHLYENKADFASRKKKSKFQTFKNFFVKKKRKEPPAPDGESVLKQSRSSDNVSNPDQAEVLSDSEEYETGSKGSMGNKALSHDSVFVSDKPSSEANDGLVSSQENIQGKVKSLQFQLQQAIRMDSPLAVTPGKKCDDGGALSEDDGLPKSPPEISTLHTVLTGSTHRAGNDASSSLASPLVSPDRAPLPADFSSPATPLACLDNSVAKHRIAVKHKACARRRPARVRTH